MCYKQSRLTNGIPFGVCSAFHGGEHVALCPRRFLQNRTVFSDIAIHHFGSTNDLLLFSEVKLPGAGNFDFVMVKHRPMSVEIEDFIAIEFQTGQTTSTGGLVQGFLDFMAGGEVHERNYAFGMNTYDIWKRTFTQILNKGVIMENWKHKVYWVLQDSIYRDFERRYSLHTQGFAPEHHTVFVLYDLQPDDAQMQLVQSRMTSASVDQLFDSFRNNPNMPSLSDFKNVLQDKINSNAQLSLEFGATMGEVDIDPAPPTESGRPIDE